MVIGKELPVRGLHDSIRLYLWAKEFSVLPEIGGVYNQDPRLIDYFSIIEEGLNKGMKEKAEMDRIEAERNRKVGKY